MFLLVADAAAPDAAAGATAAAVPEAGAAAADVAVAAGWLCANAGAAIAVVSASSAQIILRMANANARCFISPLIAVRNGLHCFARRHLVNSPRDSRRGYAEFR